MAERPPRAIPVEPTGLALIGCGYWGLKYLRVLSDFPDVEVRLVCDRRSEPLAHLRTRHPRVRFTADYEEAIRDSTVDAVVIATEANSHYSLCRAALLSGKHVLVEKPLTTNLDEARTLVGLAKDRDRVLLVGHTFLYNAAVRKIKEYLQGSGVPPRFGTRPRVLPLRASNQPRSRARRCERDLGPRLPTTSRSSTTCSK